MITLAFRNSTPDCVSTDPVPCFRIDRELLSGGGGRLARHADHAWHVDGRRFLRLECEDPVTIRFEDAGRSSELYGPFTNFSSTDGICYADHEVFAHFDEDTRCWFSHRDRTWWPVISVQSAREA
jgi:hypothetical protein